MDAPRTPQQPPKLPGNPHVLSTALAFATMAQLVNGLPLEANGWDALESLLIRGHPLIGHDTLCDGVVEQTREFRDFFDERTLRFDAPVLQAYQDAALVAVSIHQIAVLLFQLEPKLSTPEEARRATLEGGRRIYRERRFEPRPTLFFHVDYMDYDQYPNGLADCVDLYFHSGRKYTTFRVWRLLDSKLNAFANFLLSTEPIPPSPFPILASDANLHRHDPWGAIALHHVFRDPWERKFPPTKPPETRDVRSTGDYPELAAMFTQLEEASRELNTEQAASNELSSQTAEPGEDSWRPSA
ncbi:hypothetical protein C8A05DRAFT_47130 [Staphylotrichum tortipilum]|uniref:Uncharacterized protein n=1 Tax=Staphylotrichum tortipilum TaxID=2831512 RepID=A0AAN6RPV1_9PEZI|nr:hypothetical protein C8A05DRAFT_47130 [Staphylotrichum longicolle]